MKITKSGKSRIVAADEFEDVLVDDGEGLNDTIDTLADNIEDLQDTVEDVQEDDVNIAMENNIDGHYIAECDRCHGIFISAVCESDQDVTSITGTCPLCEKETEQNLKWVIKSVSEV